MSRTTIQTPDAPAAIGTYSQAVRVGNTVYISGQIPLDPATMEVVSDEPVAQIDRVFTNLAAICEASGGAINDIVSLRVLLTDLGNFPHVNEIMAKHMSEPYPARAAFEVSALPKGVGVEIEAIMDLGSSS